MRVRRMLMGSSGVLLLAVLPPLTLGAACDRGKKAKPEAEQPSCDALKKQVAALPEPCGRSVLKICRACGCQSAACKAALAEKPSPMHCGRFLGDLKYLSEKGVSERQFFNEFCEGFNRSMRP